MAKVVRNTLIYTLGNILPQAVAFILLPIYTKYLPPVEYGIVNSMLVIQALLAILFSFALDRSIIRLYWDYKSEQDRKAFLGTISIAIVFISILFFFSALLFSKILQRVFPDISFYPYYFYTLIITFSFNLSLLSKNFYRLKNQASKYFFISAFELLLTTGFILWFIIAKDEMGLGVIKGKMIAFLVLTPVYLMIIFGHINLKFDFKMFKSALFFTLPIIPTLFAAWMLGQSDKIFIADFLTLDDVGIYSLSRRIAGLISLVAGAFMLAYHPMYFELANSEDQVKARLKLYKYNNIFILSIILISFILVFFSKEIIILFLNERYHSAHEYVPWLVVAVLIGSVSSTIIGASFQQSKKMKQDMYIGIMSAILTVILYYFLIRSYGLNGMIFSTVLSTLIIFIFAYFYALKKCYFIQFNWKQIGFFSLVLVGLHASFALIVDVEPITSIILKFITVGCLLFGVSILWGKEFKNLLHG